MSIEFFYRTAAGRLLVKSLQKAGTFHIASWFLKTKASAGMVPGYIKKNRIDMSPFEGQSFGSFSAFFARSKNTSPETDPNALISPCDGLLTAYHIFDEMIIPMKGSHYRLSDILPERKYADFFRDGLCLVFRLQASDYHHFCCFDDAALIENHFIPGLLHSVQPIACEKVPVYRLNRRWWHMLDTEHFGTAAQIEVGAMLVGGVTLAKDSGVLRKGEEMGNFELAGSTIILLLDASVKNDLRFFDKYMDAIGGTSEVPITYGEAIGVLKQK